MVTRSFPTTGVTYGLERARWLQMDPEQADGKVNQSLSLTLPPGRELSIYYSLMYLFIIICIFFYLKIYIFPDGASHTGHQNHDSPKCKGNLAILKIGTRWVFSVCTKTSTEPGVLGLVWPSDCSELLFSGPTPHRALAILACPS